METARKKKGQQQKGLTFGDILKGNFIYRFIYREQFTKNIGIIILIPFFAFVMIYTNHLAGKKISKVNELKEQAEEYKSRNALAQSKLIKVKMESQLGKEVIADSLLPLESHPHKLLIKLDKKNVQQK